MKKLILTIAVVLVSLFSKAQPTISSVNPLKARIDSIVTITGTNYVAHVDSNIVYFGPVKAEVVFATTTQLKVKVPIGAGHQPISVTTRALTATDNMPFNVLFPAQGILSTGSFPTKIDSITSNTPYRIVTTDFDGDGRPDVIFGHGLPASIQGFTIYRNTSAQNTFSLAAKQVFNTGSINARIYTADIDGDGKKDIIAPNSFNQSFSVYRNTSTIGNISFAPRVNFLTALGTQPTFAHINDIDGDGKLDVVTANYPVNGFQIFRNTSTIGTISFNTPLDYTTQGTYPTDIAIADLNNDGKKEIIIGNSQNINVSIFRNVSTVGDIILATPFQYAVTMTLHGLGIADLNNDGKLDIIAADFSNSGSSIYANTITVLQNNAVNGASFNASSFNAGVPFTVGSGSSDIKIDDLNGDGKTDILVGNFQSTFVTILSNNSNANSSIALSNPINISTGSQAAFVENCDLNLDGKPDIISSNYGSNTISFLISNMAVLSNENLISFTAQSIEKNALLKWQLDDTKDIESLMIQHSKNAINWKDIYVTKSFSNRQEFVHEDLTESVNYYRLVQYTKTGKFLYSDIKVLNNSKFQQNNVLIYPNPAKNAIVVSSKNAIKEIVITDIHGNQMATFVCNNPTSCFLSLLSFQKGTYLVKTTTTKGMAEVYKLIVQ